MNIEEIEKKLTFKTYRAEITEWDKVSSYLEEILEAQNCDKKVTMEIVIMLEEVFVNIASYAYKDDADTKEHYMDLGVGVIDGYVYLMFVDSGVAFNPLEREDPDIYLSVEEKKIGGLGIYMVKKWSDEIIYERKDNKNILMFKKKIL